MALRNHIGDLTFYSIRWDILLCLFFVLATVGVYWQVGNHAFINLDDGCYVTDNRHAQEGISLENLWWALTATECGNWHPLTWLSHMLDCELYGMEAGQHHMTNVLFHILNTLLLFFIFKRMTGAMWPSAFVAVLFALHPLHVESVAWVAERKDVLSAFFWMLTMWAYLWYVAGPGVMRYLLVLFLFMLGLMAKPMLVTLPFVLLLLDYWPLRRIQSSPSLGLFMEKVPLLAFSAASSIVTIIAQQRGGSLSSLEATPLNERIANALVSYMSYLGKMIWPHDLAVLYPHPGMPPWWHVVGACLLILLITVVAIRNLNARPYMAVGWLWYMGTLVPVIGLVQIGLQAMADRYTYISLIGAFIIIAWGVPDLTRRWASRGLALGFGAAAMILILMGITLKQVRYWNNSILLYEHALAITKDNYMVHNNLGSALAQLGRQNEAIGHYAKALEIAPKLGEAHYNLAQSLSDQGRWAEAIVHYEQMLRLNPSDFEAHNNIGFAMERIGRLPDAVKHYSEALRLKPDCVAARYNLGNVRFIQGNLDEAMAHYVAALRLDPGFWQARNGLGIALLKKGNRQGAIIQFQEVLRQRPKDTIAHKYLQEILAD